MTVLLQEILTSIINALQEKKIKGFLCIQFIGNPEGASKPAD